MRDRSEIRQKIKQAQFRHTKRELVARFGKGEWPAEEVTSFKKEKRDFFAHASIPEIAKDYPDVAALLWALGERGVEEGLMAEATLVGRMGGVFLWADTPEEATTARDLIEELVDAASLSTSPSPKLSWWQRMFG